MKRDPRLHGLSSDHHHALHLARRAVETARGARGEDPVALRREARAIFTEELAPHFAVEERILFPALAAAGDEALVARALTEHAALRALAAEPDGDPIEWLARFGRRLHDHVRFEERQVFERAQVVLTDGILEDVHAARPKLDAACTVRRNPED